MRNKTSHVTLANYEFFFIKFISIQTWNRSFFALTLGFFLFYKIFKLDLPDPWPAARFQKWGARKFWSKISYYEIHVTQPWVTWNLVHALPWTISKIRLINLENLPCRVDFRISIWSYCCLCFGNFPTKKNIHHF